MTAPSPAKIHQKHLDQFAARLRESEQILSDRETYAEERTGPEDRPYVESTYEQRGHQCGTQARHHPGHCPQHAPAPEAIPGQHTTPHRTSPPPCPGPCPRNSGTGSPQGGRARA